MESKKLFATNIFDASFRISGIANYLMLSVVTTPIESIGHV
jgi:hypothetical protein